MKVCIYLRVSSEEQNPENQLTDCLKLCERLNLPKPLVLTEEKSVWKDDSRRPIFERLLEDVRKGRVSTIVVWDFDRLFRNRSRFIDFMREYKKLGLKVYSVRQNWFEELDKVPSPWNEIVGDQLINVLGWLAEEESLKKSHRVKSAVRVKDGQTLSYKGNKWGRKPIPAAIGQKVLELRDKGKSVREIAREVGYWDSNNHFRNVSVGAVHKLLSGKAKAEASQS